MITTGTLSVDDREPLAFYQSLAEHYLDEKRLAEWRRTAALEKRTVLRLTPQRIRTIGLPDVWLPRVRTRSTCAFRFDGGMHGSSRIGP